MFTYGRLVSRAGATPFLLPFRRRDSAKVCLARATQLLDRSQALLLGGGVDVDPNHYDAPPSRQRIDRERDAYEIRLIEAARDRGLPMLGICRGCQLLNIMDGGSLRDLRGDRQLHWRHGRGRTHEIHIQSGTNVHQAIGSDQLGAVRSYHGQAIERVAGSLRVAAVAADGVVEAIELAEPSKQGWTIGVQWHPELSIRKRAEHRLIDELVRRARKGLMATP